MQGSNRTHCKACGDRIPCTHGHKCECGHLLAAGAYTRWWCPVHGDMEPHWYAVDAARELNAKYLQVANELFALQQSTVGVTEGLKR